MRLAFYAPMKPPDHPVPSGDRAIAQALLAALDEAGAVPEVVSRLRLREGKGDRDAQKALATQAQEEVARLLSVGQYSGWRAWVSYHNYYKAPDLIGPAVSRALNIPYVVIEATRAKKRLAGPWHAFAEAAEAATDHAAAVFHFSARDAQALHRDAPEGQKIISLPPFLNLRRLPEPSELSGAILSVGMMRRGDKTASYEIIAETLACLPHRNWRLEIVGDGPARSEVEALMRPFGEAVTYLGQLEPRAVQKALQRARVFFWPGVNEALGMVYLEAQASGVPVVAQDRPGMREVLAPGAYPDPGAGPQALAQRLQTMLDDEVALGKAGAAARQFVARDHLLPAAAVRLKQGLEEIGVHA
ncbi:MAG: glycosyltransferase [Pseudomonadota bacterium]